MTTPGLADSVVSALQRALPGVTRPVALHEPCFQGSEWDYVKECLDTGWVSSAGRFVDRFEDMLGEMTGAPGVTATVNGTAALHICLLLAGVEPGDEVLVPAITFVATANAVTYCGATPHFADCETVSLGIDAAKLADHLMAVGETVSGEFVNRASGRPIRALLVTHVLGHPADLDALARLCNRFGIVLIEDAAEALGSSYKDRHAGTVGQLGALSFNGNKIITTGGGGAVLTRDGGFAARAKHLTTTARIPDSGWDHAHDEVGYNYRMPNINAAMGCAQLEQLPHYLDAKRRLAERYGDAFAGLPGVAVFGEPPYGHSNYWLNAIQLKSAAAGDRDAVLAAAQASGFQCRPLWRPLHRLPMYDDCPRMNLATAEDMHRRMITLPSSATLGAARSGG